MLLILFMLAFTSQIEPLLTLLKQMKNVTRKSALIILSEYIFLKIDPVTPNILTITASDIDNTLSISFTIQNGAPGAIAVYGAKLFDTLTNLLKKYTQATFTENDSQILVIKSGHSTNKLPGLDEKSFFTIPQIQRDPTLELQLDVNLLKDAINLIFHAISDDGSRVFRGAYVDITTTTISFVGTNGKKLCVAKIPCNSPFQGSAIVDKRTLYIVKTSLCTSQLQYISLRIYPERIVFFAGESILYSQKIDEIYPDYTQIIPKKGVNVEIPNEELVNTINIIMTMAPDTLLTKWSFSQNTLTIESASTQGYATDGIQLHYNGPDFAIGLNSQYILDIISLIPHDTITFNFNDPLSPISIISQLGMIETLGVIMAMHLS
jgi:DNA polymerase-3 subunit beta